ncbi:hypothetical protein NP233_g4677 [Leucocoprinus birnbaumii]|uniref:Matrin-type domain-containing protein n=1 Tax=Leucocoprinus birnbaumii TaxID=56174 RepID=A0AAD5VVL7_9AGAR|nr:hypothetical protein NP233_g4677 [Leucocoprinus birnbaumii]
MSEYWVSKKKYFCKYCEIYIADDAPSRQHHENGMRHKGNVERYIRGIYKAGEKRKKDQEEEKREMARVEQAARAAFAQDVSTGHAKASSAPEASTSSAARKPATKPSNPYANYTTAAQLGYTDPDVEKMQIRQSQGLVGDWEVVESTPTPVPAEGEGEDMKPALEDTAGGDGTGTGASTAKRPAEVPPEDDTRIFKLRKKTATVGLGEIYDPGLIPIKLKKKEEKSETPEASSSLTTSTTSSTSEVPKWSAISLKPKEPTNNSVPKTGETNGSTTAEDPAASRWSKVQWSQPINEEETAALSEQLLHPSASVADSDKEPTIKSEEGAPVMTKVEPNSSLLPPEPEQPVTGGLFKKRKTPAGAGRGRRQL